jgi:hypothetical protein
MDFLRGFLYWLARILGNINAVRREPWVNAPVFLLHCARGLG